MPNDDDERDLFDCPALCTYTLPKHTQHRQRIGLDALQPRDDEAVTRASRFTKPKPSKQQCKQRSKAGGGWETWAWER
jgi:hypothetical protein